MHIPSDLETEQQLIERAKTDSGAFGELYDLHYAKIFNYILRRTADVAVAEDVTTEVFMKALDKIQNFTWRGLPFSAWLYRIASNEIANHYRDKDTKHASLEAMAEESGYEPASEIDIEASYVAEQDVVERHAYFLQVQQSLVKLSPKYQEVLALRYFEKKSIAEISHIVGKRPGTVKSLLSRGLRKLRQTSATTIQPFATPTVISTGDKKS